MPDSLANKTALVTGGAQRLGRSLCLALAAQGAGVVIHYNSSGSAAADLGEHLQGLGAKAWTVQADLSDPREAEELIPRALKVAGPLDLLINNASIFDPSTLGDVTFDDVTANAAVNAWAPFVLSRHFAAQDREGAVVNLLDTRVYGYDWQHVAYILSKHLLHVLTRMTALEYAPKVRVNAVAPGLILPPPGQDESYLAKLAPSLPLQRYGSAEDIADAALFLLRSPFITGQVLYVDGGRHLREQT
jgi:pteridine reductase